MEKLEESIKNIISIIKKINKAYNIDIYFNLIKEVLKSEEINNAIITISDIINNIPNEEGKKKESNEMLKTANKIKDFLNDLQISLIQSKIAISKAKKYNDELAELNRLEKIPLLTSCLVIHGRVFAQKDNKNNQELDDIDISDEDQDKDQDSMLVVINNANETAIKSVKETIGYIALNITKHEADEDNKNIDTLVLSKIQALFIIVTALATKQKTIQEIIKSKEEPEITETKIDDLKKFKHKNNNNLKYYKFVPYKYRPPIKNFKDNDNKEITGLSQNTTDYFKYKMRKLLSIILFSSKKGNNLFTVIDSNKQLSKSLIDIYIYLCFIFDFVFDFEDMSDIRTDITQIIININKYNAYLLLYHYLFMPGKIYKIPSFNYYKLPLPDKNNVGMSLYFESEEPLNLELLTEASTEEITEEIKDELQSNTYYNIKKNIYSDVLRNIELNIISGKYRLKKEAFKRAKDTGLPPAINDHLYEFYKYNINLLLQKVYKQFEDATNNKNNKNNENKILSSILSSIQQNIHIDIEAPDVAPGVGQDVYTDVYTDSKIINYYILSKIVQELVKQNMENYIETQSNRILEQVIKHLPNEKNDEVKNDEVKNDELIMILAPREFAVAMNNTEIELMSEKSEVLPTYQFSNVEDDPIEKFIIYSDEYSNSELIKSKYELIVNKEIYSALLNGESNPFILDSNEQSSIYPLLKTHAFEIIRDLIHTLSYNEFNNINTLGFLSSEFKNHVYKLTKDTKKYTDWLDHFVLYQKNAVKAIILSNDKFGNNIPMYLEESFNIVMYITNQYLSEMGGRGTELYLNTIIGKLEIHEDENTNILVSMVKNTELEIKKINEKLKKISKEGKTSIALRKKMTELTGIQDKIQKNIQEKKEKKEKEGKEVYLQGKILAENSILKRYKECFSTIGISTIALSAMIKSDKINKDTTLLTFSSIVEELAMFSESKNIPQFNVGSNDTQMDKIASIIEFYEKTNKLSTIYFTFGEYHEYNEVLYFTKKLLIFMTTRFICYPYLMLLKKTLFNYFKTIYPSKTDEDISNKVNYCLTNELLLENYKSIENILYTKVSRDLVENTIDIFYNQEEKYLFESQSIKDILDNVVNLLTINPVLSIPEDSPFFKIVIQEINAYFETFISTTILNWMVIIENVFKFNINQGRIIRSIGSLVLQETK